MAGTEDLKAEHEGIRLMLQVLNKICEILESGKAVDSIHLDRIMEFLTVFVDRCHHGKEEDFLFPELEKQGISKGDGLIGVLLTEHEEGRGFVKRMAEGVEKIKGGGSFGFFLFKDNSRKYTELLSRHIEKENDILFPMADKGLSREIQDWLQKSFDALEKERIGIGKHEEFHSLLSELRKIYLD
ncbi:MAG: hemerythrin domain-containing protein [Thermodesulfobacteriota bacterium]